jgi:hypothetical protein
MRKFIVPGTKIVKTIESASKTETTKDKKKKSAMKKSDLEEILTLNGSFKVTERYGRAYLHINNGGVTFEAFETKGGPCVAVGATHFGLTTNVMLLPTDKVSLEKLASLFQRAADGTKAQDKHDVKATTKPW